jgi:hypothetical protein
MLRTIAALGLAGTAAAFAPSAGLPGSVRRAPGWCLLGLIECGVRKRRERGVTGFRDDSSCNVGRSQRKQLGGVHAAVQWMDLMMFAGFNVQQLRYGSQRLVTAKMAGATVSGSWRLAAALASCLQG